MSTTTSRNMSPDLDDLVGLVALVTGATSGIGRAASHALTARGARVPMHGRNQDRAEQVVAAIRLAGGDAEVVLGELGDPLAAQSLARSAVELGEGTSTSSSTTPGCSRSAVSPRPRLSRTSTLRSPSTSEPRSCWSPRSHRRWSPATTKRSSACSAPPVSSVSRTSVCMGRQKPPWPCSPDPGPPSSALPGPDQRRQLRPHQHNRDRGGLGLHRADDHSSTRRTGRCR